jgi:hypothetical protein
MLSRCLDNDSVSKSRGGGSEGDTNTAAREMVMKETRVLHKGSGSEGDTGTTIGEAVVKETNVLQ